MASFNNHSLKILVVCWFGIFCGCASQSQPPTSSPSPVELTSGKAGEKSNENSSATVTHKSSAETENSGMEQNPNGESNSLLNDQSKSNSQNQEDDPGDSSKPAMNEASPSLLQQLGNAKTDSEIQSDMDRQLQQSISNFQHQLVHTNQLSEAKVKTFNGKTGLEEMLDSTSSPQLPDEGSRLNEISREGLVPINPASYSTGSENNRLPNQHKQPDSNGGYDAVVARQLRSLAEKETDPVLRNRLFEEYQRYIAR